MDRELKPLRIMAAPVVIGVSKLAEVYGASPLDRNEQAGGELSIAAVLYQYGGQLDALVLLFMWLLGVMIPRFVEVKKRQREEEEAKAAGQLPCAPSVQLPAKAAPPAPVLVPKS